MRSVIKKRVLQIPGNYQVAAEMQGFKKSVRTGFEDRKATESLSTTRFLHWLNGREISPIFLAIGSCDQLYDPLSVSPDPARAATSCVPANRNRRSPRLPGVVFVFRILRRSPLGFRSSSSSGSIWATEPELPDGTAAVTSTPTPARPDQPAAS